ncbi:LiaI-LiaF-like domain-containing protein [Bacillus salitolerans]|uniref:LiaI-LiaF-like domain-containing protein n=1 Tax=Bacillus salitolerans TaxID=1437434 RepID=A0ABW4LLF0_9BACI
MKKQGVFPGIILIGIGLYFLLDQLNLYSLKVFYTWPTLLIIIGIAFLAQAYTSRDYQNIVPGFILFGFGLHFHFSILFSFWPEHWAMFTLIIGCAFLLKYQQTKSNLLPGLLLLILSILALFYHEVIGWLGWIGSIVNFIEKYWPIGLIVAGVYLLFIKKK